MNRRQLARTCTLEAIASAANLLLAAGKARQGKARRPDVENWWLRRETEVLRLREELLTETYQPGAYRFFEIHDPKRRMIAAAPFRDRVVHHALCNFMAPVLERHFIARSFSCQIGKGTTAARECCRQLTNRFAYVLKCDVRKFFPSIDQQLLREKLAGQIRCPGVQELTDKIIGSYQTGPEIPAALFPGDDLAEVMQRPRGLPIGNLTSQFWGNFYLDEMDHQLTEGEQHGAYLRYTDDFLLFGDDKERLWELREIVVDQLAAVRLKLAEPKSRLLATREGVPFCGFRFLPDLRPRILGATKRRFERRRYQLFRRATERRRPVGLTQDKPAMSENHQTTPAPRSAPAQSRSQTGAPGEGLARLTVSIFAWYQFSREGNSEGLRRAYTRWPLAAWLKRRQRRTSRVLRGASWNNNNRDNLLSANRNNNPPDNRNNNIGFRCVLVDSSSRKAENFCPMPGGAHLPDQCQESSLTAAPAPVGNTGKDAALAVAGKRGASRVRKPQPAFSARSSRCEEA